MNAIVRRVAIASALVLAATLLWMRRVDLGSDSAQPSTVPVVIAAKDIPEWSILDSADLVVARWPAGEQLAGVSGSMDDVVNRVTRTTVYEGQAMTTDRLAPKGGRDEREVRRTLTKGPYHVRAISVSDQATLIRPDTRVNVMVVLYEHEKLSAPKLVAANVRLLGMALIPQRERDGSMVRGAVATLELTGEEAERVMYATVRGHILFEPHNPMADVVTRAVSQNAR